MNFNMLKEWITPISIIFSVAFPIFTGYSSIYRYKKSDLFIQEIFSSATKVALYRIYKGLVNLILSIFLTCLLYIYFITISDMTIPEFFIELNKHPNEKIIILIYSFILIGTFLLLIMSIPAFFSSFFPSQPKSNPKNFYLLSQEIKLSNLPYNTKVFFLSIIDKKQVLLCCYLKNEIVRITYPIEELSKRKIFYKKKTSFWQELKELNKTLTKKIIIYFYYLDYSFCFLI